MTAPVQSHLSFIQSSFSFGPCCVCHPSFSLHTENILAWRLCSSVMSMEGVLSSCVHPFAALGKWAQWEHPLPASWEPTLQKCATDSQLCLLDFALNSVTQFKDKTAHSKKWIYYFNLTFPSLGWKVKWQLSRSLTWETYYVRKGTYHISF